MSVIDLHNILIAVHTVAASVCFISGLIVLTPPVGRHANRASIFSVFLGVFPFLLIPLFLAVAFDWPTLDGSLQIIFPALGVLDLFMAWRAFMAYRVLRSRAGMWQQKYIGHVGFNVISLFAGFVIVLAIDLGAPIWAVVIIAVVSIVGGVYGVNRVKATEKRQLSS